MGMMDCLMRGVISVKETWCSLCLMISLKGIVLLWLRLFWRSCLISWWVIICLRGLNRMCLMCRMSIRLTLCRLITYRMQLMLWLREEIITFWIILLISRCQNIRLWINVINYFILFRNAILIVIIWESANVIFINLMFAHIKNLNISYYNG
jgi:hypothetical protein